MLHVRSLLAAAAVSFAGVAVAIALGVRGIAKAIDAVNWTQEPPRDWSDDEDAWCSNCGTHRARKAGGLCPICVDAGVAQAVLA